MELKRYQAAALEALRAFLDLAPALGPAASFAREVARQDREAEARGERPEARAYEPLPGLEEVPYACVRLPTGGGKTRLACEALALGGRPSPLALWMVPSGAILGQTADALKDRRHAYRRRLDALFDGRVRVWEVGEFEDIRPQDLAGNACVVVATIQSFRVQDTTGRRVYAHNEAMEAHFAGLPTEGMEAVGAEEAGANPRLRAGQVKLSFANLLRRHRPLMIVDEAHNAVTGLSRVMQSRLLPRAVVEFTATPQGASNVLFAATAQTLRDEEMIKLPIRVEAHGDWRAAVDGAVAQRARLEALGGLGGRHPVALYQAQARGGEATVEAVRAHLIGEALVPEAQVRVATGESRELDGVDLGRPGEPTRHVITVQALREGWDCPTAYVLCATQRLGSATAVEQLLGRVLRMPDARRREAEDLNMAYAHISEARFADALGPLVGTLVAMGFTRGEAGAQVRPPPLELSGGLFADPDPVAPRPVLTWDLPDTAEARAALRDLPQAALVAGGGRLRVGLKGALPEAAVEALAAAMPEAERPAWRAAALAHAARVEAALSPAERGEAIELPLLMCEVAGERFAAEAGAILERAAWSILDHPAAPTEAELRFGRAGEVLEMDVEGERVVFARPEAEAPALPHLPRADDAETRAGLARLLVRLCRAPDIPEAELAAWVAGALGSLLDERGVPMATLVRWRHEVAGRLRLRIAAARESERGRAFEGALFGPGALPRQDGAATARLDARSHADVALRPTGAFRFRRHLLGPDRMAQTDGDPFGEEFQCAWSLDGLEDVAAWARNVARHPASFWLPTRRDRFYPDFVARLRDGRLFVVEYKGADRAGSDDTREKELVGRLWAGRTGHAFALVTRSRDGLDPAAQMRAALGAGRRLGHG